MTDNKQTHWLAHLKPLTTFHGCYLAIFPEYSRKETHARYLARGMQRRVAKHVLHVRRRTLGQQLPDVLQTIVANLDKEIVAQGVRHLGHGGGSAMRAGNVERYGSGNKKNVAYIG